MEDGNYKFAFCIVSLIWIITIAMGSYILWDINKTLNGMHKTMQDDQITKYIDAGWMPPLNYFKVKRPVPKKGKDK
ncbi:MAG: hypothetical protein DRJ10_01265 [Bacteroidetes bacterium]|nr:MAG: hypothetical protein DRJ10_01265 [Bacteroidota bacterium]